MNEITVGLLHDLDAAERLRDLQRGDAVTCAYHDGRASVLTAIGISISGGMTIGAIGHVMAIRSVVGQQATAGFLRSLVLVSAGTALSAAAGYGVVHVLLSVLGTGLIGALVAAMGGAIVIVGGGFSGERHERDENAVRGLLDQPADVERTPLPADRRSELV